MEDVVQRIEKQEAEKAKWRKESDRISSLTDEQWKSEFDGYWDYISHRQYAFARSVRG